MNKFKIGNKYLINAKCKRLPCWIRDNIKTRELRTLTAIWYDKSTQHTRYYFGTNKRGKVDISGYGFRAEMLRERKPIGLTRIKILPIRVS